MDDRFQLKDDEDNRADYMRPNNITLGVRANGWWGKGCPGRGRRVMCSGRTGLTNKESEDLLCYPTVTYDDMSMCSILYTL